MMAATLLYEASVLEVHSLHLRIYSSNCSGFIQLITLVLTSQPTTFKQMSKLLLP